MKKTYLLLALILIPFYVSASIDGSCGDDNGKVMNKAPVFLCETGTPSEVVLMDGGWYWFCSGDGGGDNVICSSDMTRNDYALCGPANQTFVDNEPETGLCTRGVPSDVTYTDRWNWVCSGNKTYARCYAYKMSLCGTAVGRVSSKPTSNLCLDNSQPEIENRNDGWSWVCGSARCFATLSSNYDVEGVCGYPDGKETSSPPSKDLCGVGNPTSVILKGGFYSWTCKAGGGSASCKAPHVDKNKPTDGICGDDHGRELMLMPVRLCKAGIPVISDSVGPWSWSCEGINNGKTANCHARNVITPVNAACGYMNGKYSAETPVKKLCLWGVPSEVREDSYKWTWSCRGNKSKVDCSSDRWIDDNLEAAISVRTCSDSDNGKDYYVKGIVSEASENGQFFEHKDLCNDKGRVLYEFYCVDKYSSDSVAFECPNGCKDGACVTKMSRTQLIAKIRELLANARR
jgi:hypothetical protein